MRFVGTAQVDFISHFSLVQVEIIIFNHKMLDYLWGLRHKLLASLTCRKNLEEFADAMGIFERTDHRNILIWANDNNGTLLWINTKSFIRVAMAVIVALIVDKHCVKIYNQSVKLYYQVHGSQYLEDCMVHLVS
jgi:hypothetical protein